MSIMNKKKVVSPVGFPDFLASDEEKATESFGLSVAKAIEYEWFYRSEEGGSCEYYDKRDKYHKLRLYARGEQPVEIYKDLINGGDSESYTNYDWRPLQVIPKFVKLIVNQMTERLFEVKAEAVDKYSTDLKDSYRRSLEDMVYAKPIMQAAKDNFGVDIFPPNYEDYPETQEEIDLHMKLKYKPAIEIATEEAVKFTLDLNDYDEVQNKVIEDITVIGIGAVKHMTDPTKGIVVEYVDPANIIHSYPKSRDFKDVFYYGEVKRVTINELKRLSGGKFTDEELRDISESSRAWYRYHNMNEHGKNSHRGDDIGSATVDILYYTYKATNTISYKKKYMKNGGYKMIKKESTFDKVDDNKGYDASKKTIDVWYEGIKVLGSDYMVKYGLCENMIRPEGYLSITAPNYLIYAPELYQNRTKSLVERIIPYVDQMQQIHIKIQQMIAKARPNGIYIDVDGMSEISLGDGNFLTPLEAVKMYDETGNILGSSVNAEGDYSYGKEPIRELKNGVIDGLDRLINAYNHYLNLLRDAIGVPQGADASMPHPDTLVGIQQQVALNSNTATRHILDSSLHITKRLAGGIVLRMKDIFKYSDLKKVYINALGTLNVEVLKAIEKYHLHDLGINIELRPDQQEEQYLEQNIQQALQQQLITLDDAIDVRAISNIKLANELIKTRRIRRDKEKKAHEEKLMQIQSEGQAAAAERASQAKQMEIQTKSQADLMVIQAKSDAEMRRLEAEKAAKAELMQIEFEYNMTLRGVEMETLMMNEKMKEKEKMRRQDRNKSQESKLIEQRANRAPAINFESNHDHINGDMGLGTFEPS